MVINPLFKRNMLLDKMKDELSKNGHDRFFLKKKLISPKNCQPK